MALLLGLDLDPVSRSHLQSAVRMESASGAEHRILHASGWEEVARLARRHPVQLLVFDPFVAGALVLAGAHRFREAFPSVALLPYGAFPGNGARDVLRLADLGIRTIVVRGEDDQPSRLRSLIAEALSSRVADVLLPELGGLVPSELIPVFRYVISEGYRPLSTHEVSRFYCRHSKTLREHLRLAGLPPTQKLIVWGRLFNAAHFLTDRGRTITSVAATLSYPSESAFRHQFLRYTGIPVRQMRGRDGLGLLADHFRARHARRDWAPHPSRVRAPVPRAEPATSVGAAARSGETDSAAPCGLVR